MRPVGPRWAVPLFTALCVGVFWASLFVPRPDGSLLGSDGTYYYAYLPSLILDRDLDFTNDFRGLMQGEPEKLEHSLRSLTPRGLPANQWSVGPALLWAPFFLLAHAIALALGGLGLPIDTSGYGMLHQAFVLTGSIVWGGCGLWFLYRALCHVVEDERLVGVAVLFVAAGGNLVYYMTVEPHMSHAPSIFATGLFFYLWFSGRENASYRRAAAIGAAAGLMALLRPQDGLFLILPFIDRLAEVAGVPAAERGRALWRLAGNAIVAAACALVLFSPQLLVWELLWGSFTTSSYALEGEGFDWSRPHLLAVVFSLNRGLFVWHPILLVGLLGLVPLRQRDARLAAVLLGGFLLQWYVISSWWAWDQGKSFGGRMFIVCTPIFAIGLAAMLERARERAVWRPALIAGLIAVAANGVFTFAYVLTW